MGSTGLAFCLEQGTLRPMGVHVAEDEATVEAIAGALGETEERPLAQIAALVRLLGREGAMQLLTETQAIEAGGGMMLPNGARRRTPGGVFFVLARRKLSKEDQTAIFGAPPRPAIPTPLPPPQHPPAPVPPVQAKLPAPDRLPPRRRVVDVFEMRRHGPVERRSPSTTFLTAPQADAETRVHTTRDSTVIEDLARSENRSRVVEQVRATLAGLDPRDRHLILVDLLASLHGRAYVATAPEPPPAPQEESQSSPPSRPPEPAPSASARSHRPVAGAKVRPSSGTRPARSSTPEKEAPTRTVSSRSKVLEMIRRRPGISTSELAERVFGDDTETDRKQVTAITAALKAEGKIRSAGRGRFELDD